MANMKATTRIGVLGTGAAGRAMANGFIALGHEVRMGSRDPRNERAVAWAAAAGARASCGTFADAAGFGEIVVLATLGKATGEVIGAVGAAAFGRKVVVDLTNPLDYQLPSPPALFVGTTDSLGERVQKWLPDARVVKAFNSVGAMHFFRPQFPGGPPDMFVAGEDASAKVVAGQVCGAFGWSTADLGGIRASRWLEPMCLVWASYAYTSNAVGHAFKLLRT
jgi:8-hydroxy-5-deazaflavin:NADPH oxidoreductase